MSKNRELDRYSARLRQQEWQHGRDDGRRGEPSRGSGIAYADGYAEGKAIREANFKALEDHVASHERQR